ncbi:MAG: 30S ribosomal protein S20 [Chloroflexi bacterium]|nr:30S ribosomal protein S20 [Chloroflexota bacterium]
MAKGISAAKAHRRSVKKREINRHRNRTIRTLIRSAREAIEDGEQDAQDTVRRAMVALDRAKGKTLHGRNADRRKSRLVRLLNRTQAA